MQDGQFSHFYVIFFHLVSIGHCIEESYDLIIMLFKFLVQCKESLILHLFAHEKMEKTTSQN
jgi:hypothetical protein